MQKLVSDMSGNIWKRLVIVYKLKSPLHIGYMPFKGSVVSPTRYYVPGRNFWGAFTKRITEYICKSPDSEVYKNIGKQIMDNFRFSYFYIYDEEDIYLPKYTDDGLKFGCKDEISQYEFEHKFIGSRIMTAIESSSGTAKSESLHEIGFINNKFKDKDGNLKNTRIIGCIWMKNNTKIEGNSVEINKSDINPGIFIIDFNLSDELILGGESKYGFGHILLESINKHNFSIEAEESEENVMIKIIKGNPLIAHLKYDENIKFKGDIELLTGRGYFDPKKVSNGSIKPGYVISRPDYYFSPGTVIDSPVNDSFNGEVNWDGTMKSKHT